MEIITLDKDIQVFYKTAASFPEGILEAHQSLHQLVPYSADRKYFGISRPENGNIVYKAATEQMEPGEAKKYHCDALVLKKGRYRCIRIKDYQQDLPGIGKAFEVILTYQDIDPQGYCVEWYINEKEVTCMVRINS